MTKQLNAEFKISKRDSSNTGSAATIKFKIHPGITVLVIYSGRLCYFSLGKIKQIWVYLFYVKNECNGKLLHYLRTVENINISLQCCLK